MIRKNEEFEIEIQDMNDDGAGIGKTDGFVWFVKDAVAGDLVRAAATKVNKSYGFARTVEILKPSEMRCEPACAAARSCGGCQIQQLSYEAQLALKQDKVKNAIERIGGISLGPDSDTVFEPIMGMEEPFRYRNKAVYPIGRDKEGRIIAGFYAGRTHHIIECSDCLIGGEINKDILELIIGFMHEKHIAPYDETSHSGVVRHVLIRRGWHTGELMISIVINAKSLKGAEELSARLQAAFPMLRSFTLSVNREKTNVIMGREIINIFGPGYIEEEIFEHGAPIRFRISPLSFFQVNSEQMERLYACALDFAGLSGSENVWDMYCGVGTISLFLSRHAKKVYGVEIVPEAIENAKENAALNSIDNAEFFVGKAEEVLPAWVKQQKYDPRSEQGHIDVIVVDPPRKGCDEMCLQTMVEMQPEKIVYVSCDPATLARDLKYLSGNGYHVEKVRPCDMFPHTVHVETVVLLSRTEGTMREA